MTALPEILGRYFALASKGDQEAFFSLFTDDAVVEDEATEYRGVEGLRRWRARVPLATYTITDVNETSAGTVVTVIITGGFPGSPIADLKFRFEDYDDTHIRRLRIAP